MPALALLAACGGGAGTSDGANGQIFVSGSSTVEPITSIVLEDFASGHPDLVYEVDGPGTGDGFALFCEGATDISNASRTIRDEEVALCEESGVEYVELKVGIDGISVVTAPDNAAVDCLSFGDLYALLGPESQGFEAWSAADDLAAEIGDAFGELHIPYPDAPLAVTAPGEESGTYDSFVEIVLATVAEARVEDGAITEEDAEVSRPDYQASADDNVIIENIGGSDSSLGWTGFAFAAESADSIKLLAVDGGDGCVAPTAESITSGEYPIARDLYIYVNTEYAADNPALASMVDYYLSDEGIAAVEEAGFVSLAPEALEESRAAWEGR